MTRMADKPPVQIYVKKIQNRFTFYIKFGHYLQLFTPDSRKLLRGPEEIVAKDKNGENVPRVETIDVILVQCNNVNNQY